MLFCYVKIKLLLEQNAEVRECVAVEIHKNSVVFGEKFTRPSSEICFFNQFELL